MDSFHQMLSLLSNDTPKYRKRCLANTKTGNMTKEQKCETNNPAEISSINSDSIDQSFFKMECIKKLNDSNNQMEVFKSTFNCFFFMPNYLPINEKK